MNWSQEILKAYLVHVRGCLQGINERAFFAKDVRGLVLTVNRGPWASFNNKKGFHVQFLIIEFHRFKILGIPGITTGDDKWIHYDQGFVYPGETLMLNMKRVNLPPTSMKFKWYLERDGEYGTLPSNMRLSPSGGVLTISELRKEQEGILVCAVFTNKDFFATKQRFLIKEMNTSTYNSN
ncbi:ig-like domain-containing protein [Trichonephila clavipes]|nr:ig-like domain-containing protein [Trichonephila clavipes]